MQLDVDLDSHPFLDAHGSILLSLLLLLRPFSPPPQAQEARTVLEMRLRSEGLEGAVP